MRYIDAFNHFSPKRYFDALIESPAGQKDIGKRVRGIPGALRSRVAAQGGRSVSGLHADPVARPADGRSAVGAGQVAGDGQDRQRWTGGGGAPSIPDRFVGYSAVVPMNAPEAAAKEAERALKNGAHAVQLGTNVNGKPIDGKEFWPLYEVDREVRQADPAASGAQPRDDRLSGRGQIEIRDLLGARLAVRDRRDAVALHLLQDHGHLSESEDRLASSRRRHSLSRRPHRPQLRPDGRAHVR